ncbi:hypothetical protein AZH51_16385 [Branchiibius sp. NY16-3462-2]|nr:hypothetical protein AZH51_16385 [Branchiibius sp. NY16-3462-2]
MAGRPPGDGISGDDWLRALPRLLAAAAERWSLSEPQAPAYGECALVVPCASPSGPVALKVTWPHPEARFEHLALRAWNGVGAVRLVAADTADHALLLEQLDPHRSLTDVNLLEACETVGSLLRQLDRPALPQVGPLPLDEWHTLLERSGDHVPRRFITRAAALLRDLAVGERLVHSDLHFANVLAGQRASWLAIDPKPVTANPAFGIAPVLWNRWSEASAAHNLRAHLRLRVGLVAEAAGVDEEEAMAWSFVRCVLNACEAEPDAPVLSRWITIAKAMT